MEYERDDAALRNISVYNTRPIGASGAESFKSNSSDFNILKKNSSEFKMS